ncbi:hypothetical protein N7468_010766 [Penicillium chermesinum]|uniref:Uncharacterized protein n=1 Tax=Penicillium chermesinum TaxID=63820 RepID=A0A9W9TA12_9EURO|nr:uncharacterized protein N7468_010766 [Penicillium chermesinum]KAJ5215087.1 hypothetical protein N7468_010766 [Penicillium chermesinum]
MMLSQSPSALKGILPENTTAALMSQSQRIHHQRYGQKQLAEQLPKLFRSKTGQSTRGDRLWARMPTNQDPQRTAGRFLQHSA